MDDKILYLDDYKKILELQKQKLKDFLEDFADAYEDIQKENARIEEMQRNMNRRR